MPKAQEVALRIAGRKKGYTGERLNAFIYGSMRNSGWTPSSKSNSERSKEYGKRNS
jgi:hypothetical protein